MSWTVWIQGEGGSSALMYVSVVVNYLPNVIINLKVKLFETMNYNS